MEYLQKHVLWSLSVFLQLFILICTHNMIKKILIRGSKPAGFESGWSGTYQFNGGPISQADTCLSGRFKLIFSCSGWISLPDVQRHEGWRNVSSS